MCAKAIGVSAEEYQRMEAGEVAPTLPQLEALAFYLDVPLEHFWGTQTFSSAPEEPVEPSPQLVKIRQRIIATRLRIARSNLNFTTAELADKSSIPEEKIIRFETGEEPIPLPDLEILANALQIRNEDLFDQHGSIGNWRAEKLVVQQFLEMPQDIREFLCKPVNLPYLQLARRLSELSAEKLRGIAESLLEITF
jgi:transcriptional regulator with XRE-family HTH domain